MKISCKPIYNVYFSCSRFKLSSSLNEDSRGDTAQKRIFLLFILKKLTLLHKLWCIYGWSIFLPLWRTQNTGNLNLLISTWSFWIFKFVQKSVDKLGSTLWFFALGNSRILILEQSNMWNSRFLHKFLFLCQNDLKPTNCLSAKKHILGDQNQQKHWLSNVIFCIYLITVRIRMFILEQYLWKNAFLQ